MERIVRVVAPGIPHNITQRGNRRHTRHVNSWEGWRGHLWQERFTPRPRSSIWWWLPAKSGRIPFEPGSQHDRETILRAVPRPPGRGAVTRSWAPGRPFGPGAQPSRSSTSSAATNGPGGTREARNSWGPWREISAGRSGEGSPGPIGRESRDRYGVPGIRASENDPPPR